MILLTKSSWLKSEWFATLINLAFNFVMRNIISSFVLKLQLINYGVIMLDLHHFHFHSIYSLSSQFIYVTYLIKIWTPLGRYNLYQSLLKILLKTVWLTDICLQQCPFLDHPKLECSLPDLSHWIFLEYFHTLFCSKYRSKYFFVLRSCICPL